MSDVLSIEQQIAHSLVLERAAKRVGITLEQARAFCVALSEHDSTVIAEMLHGARTQQVARTNRLVRRLARREQR